MKLSKSRDLKKKSVYGMNLQLKSNSLEDIQESTATKTKTATKAKLPELFITLFNGTHLDYFHFRNQFEAQVV